MKRRFAALAALGILLTIVVLVVRSRADQGRIYQVAEVAAGVRRDPYGWAGRTVRVRGIVLSELDPSCTAAGASCFSLLLQDASAARVPASTPRPVLAVVAGPADPLLAQLRRIPWLGDLAPRPPGFDFTRAGIYRLRVEAAPHGFPGCMALACYRGVLLDAALIGR